MSNLDDYAAYDAFESADERGASRAEVEALGHEAHLRAVAYARESNDMGWPLAGRPMCVNHVDIPRRTRKAR
jgi:hypothetical protein